LHFYATVFANTAVEVTEISYPYEAMIQAVKIIGHLCLPPNIQYPIRCGILFAQIGITVYSGRVDAAIGGALSFSAARQVLLRFARG